MSAIQNVVLVLSIAVATTGAAATQQPAPTEAKPRATRPLTLNGCVSADLSKPGTFTLADAKPGTLYQLTGLDVREYAGRRVQVSGVPSRRVHVVGGLYPSPNVAAQAGDIDPVKAAVAAAEKPAGSTNQPVPEFRVKSVRPIPGACPQQ